jgi:hypothetical protein
MLFVLVLAFSFCLHRRRRVCFLSGLSVSVFGGSCWTYPDFWERSCGRSSRRLWFFWFWFWFSRFNRTRGFYFPSAVASHQKCPEVFWFHPAEFGQIDLVLLLNTSFLLFTVISSLVGIGGLGGCGGGWYYCLLSCVLVRCQVYAVRFGRFSRRCCMFECVRRLMVLLYCYLGIFDVSGSCISLWSLLSLVLSSWTCTEPDGITVWCCMHF